MFSCATRFHFTFSYLKNVRVDGNSVCILLERTTAGTTFCNFRNSEFARALSTRSTRVQVKEGKLEGSIINSRIGSYISFKGIPYAKPPLGNLRFCAPQALEPWQGVKDATKHGNICLQKLFMINAIGGSEDCLYLNVYTPNIDGQNGKKYPVMFFIHGGAFKSGSGDENIYGPEYLVNKDVVLVTINYRMDIFGFLSVDTEDAPGNAGLKDQVAALRWVNENISHFGGDPNNITIFGESAGSASVVYHLFSPLSKGLFQAAIAQSGAWFDIKNTSAKAADLPFKLGSALGKQTDDKKELLDFLRSIPAPQLLNTVFQISGNSDNHINFIPIIEKINVPGSTFLHTPIKQLLSAGQFNDVPVMIGYNTGEGIYFINEVIESAYEINKDLSGFLSRGSFTTLPAETEKKIWEFYFDNKPFNEETLVNMIHLRSDTLFAQSIYNFSKEFAFKAASAVYFNVFACHSELNVFGKMFGCDHIELTCHGDDLFYLFKAPEYINDDLDFSSESGKMVQKVLTLWTNFAKYKNPTPHLNDIIETKWRPIQKDKFFYLHIASKLELKEDPNKDRIEFLNNL